MSWTSSERLMYFNLCPVPRALFFSCFYLFFIFYQVITISRTAEFLLLNIASNADDHERPAIQDSKGTRHIFEIKLILIQKKLEVSQNPKRKTMNQLE